MTSKIKMLENSELAAFSEQMAMILKTGISPMEGVSVMAEAPNSKEDAVILSMMEEILSNTGSMTEAVRSVNVFPEYYLHMTELGEQAGRLDEVMEALSAHYYREAEIHAAVKHSVTYPFVLISMMLAVVFVLVMKVLPAFRGAFQQMGHELTGFSNSIMEFGLALNRYALPIFLVFAVLVLLFLLCACTEKGRAGFMKFAGRFGPGKELAKMAASCRMASGMSIALSSGLDLEKSIELTSALINEPGYAARMKQCLAALGSGTALGEALRQTGLFQGVYNRMILVGFQTGCLDEMMKKIAAGYEAELDSRISRIIAVLEPSLVAALSVVVGVLLLAVMLPMLGVMSGF